MILFPAIDLKEGKCVRLLKGEMESATIFNDNPVAQAQKFVEQGFEYLHIVDLDGAFAGKPINATVVENILSNINIPVQLGGGIRDIKNIEAWIDKGIARVILGTIAVKNPDLVRLACRLFPGKIAVSIDARNGMVATDGWAEQGTINVHELAERFADCGVSAIIYTDIERDGALQGINYEATLELANKTHIPVIASGGLSSINDIETLLDPQYQRISGAISGRAIYDGRVDPKKAMELIIKDRKNKDA